MLLGSRVMLVDECDGPAAVAAAAAAAAAMRAGRSGAWLPVCLSSLAPTAPSLLAACHRVNRVRRLA